ncbi:Aminoglycoside/hydroxyurea antibiotic resistance kinase [compost metagenome]
MGVMMYNPVDRIESMGSLKELLARRFAILKEELPFDPQRMKAWAFCKTMISAAWFQEDSSPEARFQLGLAQVIDDLKV